jgi:hypothetical protein
MTIRHGMTRFVPSWRALARICYHRYDNHDGERNMYLDHPKITATNSGIEDDRLERLNRVYGYAVGLADGAKNTEFLGKLSQLHDHKGNLIVSWFAEPTEEEKGFFVKAWQSKIGDESANVEHQLKA